MNNEASEDNDAQNEYETRKMSKNGKIEIRRASAIFKEFKPDTKSKINDEKNNYETVWINPPPIDNCCECCGRHISELKPFGGPGDPLVGDFSAALLIKHFRDFFDIGQTEACWECRDCFILDDAESYKIRFKGVPIVKSDLKKTRTMYDVKLKIKSW